MGERALAFAAACLIASCAAAPTQTAPKATAPPPPSHALLSRVPAQAVSTLYVNHALLRGDWKALLDANETPAQRRQKQGFAESEDIDHAVIAALGEAAVPENLAIYRGRFSNHAVQEADAFAGGGFGEHRGHAIWGTPARGCSKLRDQELAVGPAMALRATIDVAEGVQPGLVSERWFNQANTALHKRWRQGDAVGLELLALRTPAMADRMSSVFAEGAGMRWLAARVGGQPGFRLVAVAGMEDEERARALVYAFAAQLEALSSRPQMRLLGLAGVLEAVDLQVEGNEAVARLAMDGNVFATVKQRLGQIFAFLRRRAEQQGAP